MGKIYIESRAKILFNVLTHMSQSNVKSIKAWDQSNILGYWGQSDLKSIEFGSQSDAKCIELWVKVM